MFLTYNARLNQFRDGFHVGKGFVKNTVESFPIVEVGANAAKRFNIGIAVHARLMIEDKRILDGVIYLSEKGRPVIRRRDEREAGDRSITLLIVGDYDLGGFSIEHRLDDCPKTGLVWRQILCWTDHRGTPRCGECGAPMLADSEEWLPGKSRPAVHQSGTLVQFLQTFPPTTLMVLADSVTFVACGEVLDRGKPRVSRHFVVLPPETGIMLSRDGVYTKFFHQPDGKIEVLPDAIPR